MSEHAVRQALSRMHMREVAIARPYVDAMIADLQMAAHTTREIQDKMFAERRGEVCAAYGFPGVTQTKPFPFANGIAIIPVTGTLINRFGSSYSSLTGYNFITQMAKLAVADEDVKGVVYDVNSYGGEAAGCFECSQTLYELRGTKPMIAVVDSNSYSAGYAIASAADRIYVIPSGGAGSVGVVCMHMDMSGFLEQIGIKVTFIFSGEHKVDGNSYEPLPDDVKANYQARVDKSRLQFATLVAQNRGLDVQAVMDTEAQCYRAEDALALGLIDAIATPEMAMQAFNEDGTLCDLPDDDDPASPDPDDQLDDESATAQQKEPTMTTPTTPGAAEQAASQQAANEQAQRDKAANDARVAERARVSGILGCEEAKGREELANHIAMNTEMSVEDGKKMLAAAPKTAAAAAPAPAPAANANPFNAAMNESGGAGIRSDAAAGGGGNGGGNGQKTSLELADEILADQALATGRDFRTKASAAK